MSVSTDMLARRWFDEVWSQKRDDSVDELLSCECCGFMEGLGEISGPEAFKSFRATFLRAFPDLSDVEDTLTVGDKAVVRWVARATHCGPGLGDPTGTRCEIRGLTWLEFEEGLLVRGWSHWDHGGLMRQLQPTGGPA